MSIVDQDAITQTLADITPIYPEDTAGLSGYSSIEMVPFGDGEWESRFAPDGDLYLTMRLICWEQAGEVTTIRDIKEQQLYVPAALLADAARFDAFARALASVLSRVCQRSDRIDVMLPSDLIRFDALKLKRPQTEDQFVDALVVPSRLGRLL
jgi:hypothetical protein